MERAFFSPLALEHPDVVFEVALAIEPALHADGAGEVIFEDWPRDGAVELKPAGPGCRTQIGGADR